MLPQSVKYAIFKSDHQTSRVSSSSFEARTIFYPFNACKTDFNMIPLAVLDLLIFSPSKISIFGCNLNLEKIADKSISHYHPRATIQAAAYAW